MEIKEKKSIQGYQLNKKLNILVNQGFSVDQIKKIKNFIEEKQKKLIALLDELDEKNQI